MKEISKYICEFCHTEYADATVCKECENNHKAVKKVVDKIYHPKAADNTGYPIKIKVEMNDGKCLLYKRC